jgi:hypothetical protein
VVIPLQKVMPAALAAVLRQAPLTPEKIAFAWRTAVGPAVDRASVVDLRGATLVVVVAHEEWRREIARSASLIRSRLDSVLGRGVVAAIDVVADASGAVSAKTSGKLAAR